MKYHDMKRYLRERGFTFSRYGKGSHEIWANREGKTVLVTRSGLLVKTSRLNWVKRIERTLKR